MFLKKILSFCLAITLILGVIAPCALTVKAEDAESIHLVEELQYNTGKYYLYADVKGSAAITRQFYTTGSTALVTPNALIARQTAHTSANVVQLIPDDAENPTGFQINPVSNAGRLIAHYDKSEDGTMDTTEIGSASANENALFTWEKGQIRHAFNGASYVLVCKYISSMWRMQFVPAADAEKSGNFIVKIGELRACSNTYQANDSTHWLGCACGTKNSEAAAHTYGAAANGVRTCSVCGYVNTIYAGQASYEKVNYPEVGDGYYLAANVEGTLYVFYAGTFGATSTPSLTVHPNPSEPVALSLEAPSEKGMNGFQLTFPDPNQDRTLIITSYNASGADANGFTTTTVREYAASRVRDTFIMDEVNGVEVLRKAVSENVLVVTEMDDTNGLRLVCADPSKLGTEGVYPAMLVRAHTHSFTENAYTGDHTGHYQLCACGEVSQEVAAHTYGDWSFDAEKGTQSHSCIACGYVDTLYGTSTKVSQVAEPVIGGSYYLAANVEGKIYFFRYGSATETVPYSLPTTDSLSHTWLRQVVLETPVEGDTGFQMLFADPTQDRNLRIYCYDAKNDGANAGVMDTGFNTANYINRHSFYLDELNGVTVLRKFGNLNIMAVKYDSTKGEYRMLGVPESEITAGTAYPAMLVQAHTHSYDESAYGYDSNGHGYPCDCGSFSNYESHTFGQWTMDAQAQTQSATCSVCGYVHTVASPYFDTVDSKAELNAGLATMTRDEATSPIYATGGNVYYLMTRIDGDSYYFRHAGVTAGGNPESVMSTANGTVGNSLYATGDINHGSIPELRVTQGNTEDTYIITYAQDPGLAFYINDEGADGTIDVGLTRYYGYQWKDTSGVYQARTEFKWDEANGCLYQEENGVKYVLVVKKLAATYTEENAEGETVVVESAEEWRVTAVPVDEAKAANGAYLLTLATHEHNLGVDYACDSQDHWFACGCGYQAREAHTVESWTVGTPSTETEGGTKTGICVVCWNSVTVETPVTVSNWNITLGDKIGVNFELALTEGDDVVVTANGVEVPVGLTAAGNGVYKVQIRLAAAQMADEIAITVNGHTLEKTYSVRAYADVILAGDYTSYAKELVKSMLAYGNAAQMNFGYNTNNPAGPDMQITATMPEDAPEVEIFSDLSSVKIKGVSLVLRDKTAVRFYFKADSIDGLTFTADGNAYEPVAKDGMYYIEIADINPQDLNDMINVVVTDGTGNLAIQYSPMTYMFRMYHNSKSTAALKTLMQAMYGYHLAAKTYIANLNLNDDFAVKSESMSTLYEGVDLYEKVYLAAGYGEVDAYILTVDADAKVALKVSAGTWGETNNGAKTVANHFRTLSQDNDVLAMINGGFFDLNDTGSYLPYGAQIVDGEVRQAPSADANNYSDNWFGMTKDGKYVISNAAGYESTYAGNVQQAVGGGKLLMIDGVSQNITSERAYRTAVGVNADGDLVMVAVKDATYSDVCHIFVDMGMDIVTVLNLDGGGSTAMYVPGTYSPKALILGEDGFFPRKVADAIAIVVEEE